MLRILRTLLSNLGSMVGILELDEGAADHLAVRLLQNVDLLQLTKLANTFSQLQRFITSGCVISPSSNYGLYQQIRQGIQDSPLYFCILVENILHVIYLKVRNEPKSFNDWMNFLCEMSLHRFIGRLERQIPHNQSRLPTAAPAATVSTGFTVGGNWSFIVAGVLFDGTVHLLVWRQFQFKCIFADFQ